jgi:hypothetical protein
MPRRKGKGRGLRKEQLTAHGSWLIAKKTGKNGSSSDQPFSAAWRALREASPLSHPCRLSRRAHRLSQTSTRAHSHSSSLNAAKNQKVIRWASGQVKSGTPHSVSSQPGRAWTSPRHARAARIDHPIAIRSAHHPAIAADRTRKWNSS